MTDATMRVASGDGPAPIAPNRDDFDPAGARLEGAVERAIGLARRGDWSEAEDALLTGLRTVPPAMLPRAYIACVEAIARLSALGGPPAASRPRAVVPVSPSAEPTRPRLLVRSDPALDYAHAVLTALRARLLGRPSQVRRAS